MANSTTPLSLDRHPQLTQLEPEIRDNRVPEIREKAPTGNSAACLTSILHFHGVNVTIDQTYAEIQRQLAPGSDDAILAAARRLGLRGRRIELPRGHLEFLLQGSLLRWEFGEFVVFDSFRDSRVHLMHPAKGRLELELEAFLEAFQGVAFEFETLPAIGGRLETTWRAVLSLFARHRKNVAAVILSSVLIQILALSVPLLIALVVDQVAPRQDADLLMLVAIGMGGLVVFRGLAGLARHYSVISLQTRIGQELSLDFLNHLTDLPYSFFETHSRGDLIVRSSANNQIRDYAATGAMSIIVDGVLAMFYVVVILLANMTLGAIVLGMALIQFVSIWYLRRKAVPVIDARFKAQGKAQSVLLETISSLETIKLLGAETEAIRHWLNEYTKSLRLSLTESRIGAVADSIAQSLVSLTPLATLGVGAYLVLDGVISVGEMLALSALATGFIVPFGKSAEAYFDLQLLSTFVRMIDEVRTHDPEQDRLEVAAAPKLEGSIQLDRVSFQYSAKSKPVLRDISLDINPGEVVAIVGGSGAGKSTLASLLIGLRLPTTGRVMFDRIDLASMDLRSVRQQIGIVQQNVFLLGGTSLEANITLGHNRSGFDRVVEAARRAHIHDDIMEFPMGYKTLVPSGGAGFSGGQQQRIAIARAIVHRPAILILDEATSALDQLTERAVQESLATLPCTKIIVAHRLSTIINADRIIVLDQGRVVEDGTHGDLLAREGLYSRLVESDLM